MRRDKGFTLIELMIVIAIIAIIAAIAIPGLLQSQRASNERNASASLKTMATAEADFRANDRDANKVQDFWVADIAQLYAMIPAYALGGAPPAIKLIELSLAAADSNEYAGATTGTGAGTLTPGASSPMNMLTQIGPKAGYWYQALLNYPDLAGAQTAYGVVTDGDGPAVHNNSHFGFITFPDALGASGNTVFIINEGNTIFKAAPAAGAEVKPTANVPPGPGNNLTTDYPTDTALMATWSKLD